MGTDTVEPVTVDHDSPIPAYRQVAAILRREIESGTLTGKLPSQQELAGRFKVSRAPTVTEALRLLREDHLIHTVKGRGAWVLETLMNPAPRS
jgi:GntR family transcriptional regulator